MLPVEVIESILKKCDGKTLLNARKVNEQWKNSVDYLSRNSSIWSGCCHKEIPDKELLEYLQNYKEDDPKKWLHIYINWCSWENIDRVVIDIIPSPVVIEWISCVAVTSDLIAVGTHNGCLTIFTSSWEKVYHAIMSSGGINGLTFIKNEKTEGGYKICLVISFRHSFHIFCLDKQKVELIIQGVKSHSIYKNYICYETFDGSMTIAKLKDLDSRMELTKIWCSRIPLRLSGMKMWEGVCFFLFDNEVNIIEYESTDVTPIKRKVRIDYNPSLLWKDTQFLRDDVIISLCRDNEHFLGNIMEFFLLIDNEQYSRKVFNTWEIFGTYITSICLYGNTLILGMDVGTIYLYHVSYWQTFNIRKHSHKLVIGKHPISYIVVKETLKGRIIYVSSKLGIHEITGFLPDVY